MQREILIIFNQYNWLSHGKLFIQHSLINLILLEPFYQHFLYNTRTRFKNFEENRMLPRGKSPNPFSAWPVSNIHPPPVHHENE